MANGLWQRLAGSFDRFLSGTKPQDPLYLSNQTTGQKLQRAALIAAPILVIGGVVAVALSNVVPVQTRRQAEPTTAEVAAKILPNLSKDLKVHTNQDLQVVEAVIRPGSPSLLTGSAKNNTDHTIRSAELVFDVTDGRGSQLGAVAGKVRNIPPRSAASFEIPVRQRNAAFAIVRDTQIE
jgi:hypothetical protein